MGLFMVLIELLMAESSAIFLYLFIIFLIVITIYFYRNQVFIGEKEYISDMIEHHSMAILTSEEILKKTDNAKVANLANRIVQAQTEEIQEMQQLL
jgi:cell shape-determining protein MreC